MIYSFTNDYSEGCHPSILEALAKTNIEQQKGYGDDVHTQNASDLIRKKISNENADIHLVAGGTVANLVVLASILKPFESVISATTGHINTHEAGAIEATGHKIEEVQTLDGKLKVEVIKPLLDKFPVYHTVRPRVVYISNSTEVGSIYSKKELTELYTFCKENNLYLFIDGARLISALTSSYNDMILADIASLCDVFYIGGTKCGALLGEAIVIMNNNLKADFKYHIKQRGAMLAKGRILGIQFEQLMKNDLIFDLGIHANRMAMKISDTVNSLGLSFLTRPESNQIFPILPNSLIKKMEERYGFYIWETVSEDKSAIRLITSWMTPEEKVDMFIEDLKRFVIDVKR